MNENFYPHCSIYVFSFPAFSQTNKGTFVLCGNTNLNVLFSNTSIGTDSIETGKIKDQQFAFTAGAGYFFIENLALGLSATYSYDYSDSKAQGSIGTITQCFTIMPYYFPVAGKLQPFVGAGVGYLWLEQKDSRVTVNQIR